MIRIGEPIASHLQISIGECLRNSSNYLPIIDHKSDAVAQVNEIHVCVNQLERGLDVID